MVAGTIDVVCRLCAHMVRVSAKRAGETVACPACNGALRVPWPRPEAPSVLGRLLLETRRIPFFWQRVRVFEGGLALGGESVLWRDVVSIERIGRALHVFARGRRELVLDGKLLRLEETVEKILAAAAPFVSTRRARSDASAA